MQRTLSARFGLVLLIVSIAACNTDPGFDADLLSGADLLFLVQRPVEGERIVMDALYQGTVVDSSGCLRLGDEPDSHTVVWPPGFSLESQEGVRVVLDVSGRTVGQVGGFFRLGGGEVATLRESGPVDAAAREAALRQCPGRYWIVGDVVAP